MNIRKDPVKSTPILSVTLNILDTDEETMDLS